MRLTIGRRLRVAGPGNDDRPPAGLGPIRRRLLVVFRFGPIGDVIARLQKQSRRLEEIARLEFAGKGGLGRLLGQQRRDRQASPRALRAKKHSPQPEIRVLGRDADFQPPIGRNLDLVFLRAEEFHVRREVADDVDAIANRPAVAAALGVGEKELIRLVLRPRRVLRVQQQRELAGRRAAGGVHPQAAVAAAIQVDLRPLDLVVRGRENGRPRPLQGAEVALPGDAAVGHARVRGIMVLDLVHGDGRGDLHFDVERLGACSRPQKRGNEHPVAGPNCPAARRSDSGSPRQWATWSAADRRFGRRRWNSKA